MTDVEENVHVYNRDVKKLLIECYGNSIQFSPSNRVNEPEICFSSDITIEDLTKTLRNKDIVQSAGEILRESLKRVDFQLDDTFCDGSELKHSWENTPIPDQMLTFFSALFGIRRSRMIKIEMFDVGRGERDDDDDEDGDSDSEYDPDEHIEHAIQKQHTQLNSLFQIMYYQMFSGSRKTPLTTAFCQYQYGKSRSREILSATNRMGVSPSYNEVRRGRRLLASYAVANSGENKVPIPSTFTHGAFVCGAMDNADFRDRSSISGTESDHVTMQVLFQEKIAIPESKPSVSSMGMNKSSCLPKILPCQEVPVHPKPACKPSLPPDFKVIEMTNVSSELDTLSALRDAKVEEFLISFLRCGKKSDEMVLPTWSGTHALISSAVVPRMRVGFMPVIPSPVTDYATV